MRSPGVNSLTARPRSRTSLIEPRTTVTPTLTGHPPHRLRAQQTPGIRTAHRRPTPCHILLRRSPPHPNPAARIRACSASRSIVTNTVAFDDVGTDPGEATARRTRVINPSARR